VMPLSAPYRAQLAEVNCHGILCFPVQAHRDPPRLRIMGARRCGIAPLAAFFNATNLSRSAWFISSSPVSATLQARTRQ